MPVRILALPLVIPQVVPCRKRIFNRDFVHGTSVMPGNSLDPASRIVSPRMPQPLEPRVAIWPRRTTPQQPPTPSSADSPANSPQTPARIASSKSDYPATLVAPDHSTTGSAGQTPAST